MKQVEKYAKYQPYLDFIERYKSADNAADGSERDANANVENKNITTMEGELFKGDFIGVNRLAMWQKIKELYDEGLAEEYLRQLEEHEIYRHDETALKPYCVSITMYPFLFGGITSIGGLSDAPTNIHSYTGGIINLVFAIASQFAGAVSTPEFLPYFDYFLRKEYGDDYYLRADEVVDLSLKKRTIRKVVEDLFQQAVYSLNQPAAARNFQCVREDTTQLWTPQGFKYLSELKEGDTCFVWKDGKISEQPIKLLCLENSHNFSGGYCIDLPTMAAIRKVADKHGVPIHMDGARLFHAAASLGTTPDQICQYVDSVMFCVSKGLGAPVGSLLCGSEAFCSKARNTRKLLGGVMRQAGVVAAPAIYALEHNVERLQEDIDNARLAHSMLKGKLKKLILQEEVQTNILMMDLSQAGIQAPEFCARAKEKGLHIRPIRNNFRVRLVFYKGITRQDAVDAANIILSLDGEL